MKFNLKKEMEQMKLKIDQTWKSENHPHENFKIYDVDIDTTCDCIKDFTLPFEQQPEASKIYFWERTNKEAFEQFVIDKKGNNYDSTYPYAWAGESKKSYLVSKIKKFNMELR
jgi:hypothetical protein